MPDSPHYAEYTCPACKTFDKTSLYSTRLCTVLLYCGNCKTRYKIYKAADGAITVTPIRAVPYQRVPVRYSEPCRKCEREAYIVPDTEPPMVHCQYCEWRGRVEQLWLLRNAPPETWAKLRATRAKTLLERLLIVQKRREKLDNRCRIEPSQRA